MQREREKKERAAAKREKRQERTPADAAPVEIDAAPGETELSAADLMRYVEAIHKEYEDGVIDLDTFEEKKQALLARVRID
jgi:ribosomal protein L25 (general stress protein Ctc)